jgi:hypothetical protein
MRNANNMELNDCSLFFVVYLVILTKTTNLSDRSGITPAFRRCVPSS